MRIVIADDDVLLRDALARLLTGAGHEIVGQAGDGPGLVRRTCATRPELVIADVRMPPSQRDEGLRAVRQVRASAPAIGILVLSHHLQLRYAVELLGTDARGVGYVLKQRMADADGFLATVEAVAAGHAAIDPEVAAALLGRLRGAALDGDARRLLSLVAEGRSDASIAACLRRDERDVARGVAGAFAALGLVCEGDGHERVSALVRRATQSP